MELIQQLLLVLKMFFVHSNYLQQYFVAEDIWFWFPRKIFMVYCPAQDIYLPVLFMIVYSDINIVVTEIYSLFTTIGCSDFLPQVSSF